MESLGKRNHEIQKTQTEEYEKTGVFNKTGPFGLHIARMTFFTWCGVQRETHRPQMSPCQKAYRSDGEFVWFPKDLRMENGVHVFLTCCPVHGNVLS